MVVRHLHIEILQGSPPVSGQAMIANRWQPADGPCLKAGGTTIRMHVSGQVRLKDSAKIIVRARRIQSQMHGPRLPESGAVIKLGAD